ncbi:hypothetical protein CHS0354_006131 [Potamilus streckersoni]|uniref:E3 ubiquitin-protein ligase n=1 Tax=Potamilus streckersoni TaxID=2493646 RepID=A0AAE0SUG7_9BIVA|nr:hypothetical protein CHS0354_006131 [Potamilus streckersoni]
MAENSSDVIESLVNLKITGDDEMDVSNSDDKSKQKKDDISDDDNPDKSSAFADEDCVICLDKLTDAKTLKKCSHSFCTLCIDQHFKNTPHCPVCFTVYGIKTGNQPKDGYMDAKVNQKIQLPGYEGHGAIVLYYSFFDGIQTEEHPNPGRPYFGTNRTAYLPNTSEGQKVLRLLKEAFKRRLVFTVGSSRTTGCDNVVTWNDIHHKTNTCGGTEEFGYPDSTYLRRVQEELAAHGVTEESILQN